MYVKVENDIVIKYPYNDSDLRIDNPNTSFPAMITDETRQLNGMYPVEDSTLPDFNFRTHKLVEDIPVKQDDKWVKNYEIIELSEFEQQEILSKKIQEIKNARNLELKDSDYILLSDVNITNKEVWIQYRQALRDIPQQSGFPFDIEWPNKPI